MSHMFNCLLTKGDFLSKTTINTIKTTLSHYLRVDSCLVRFRFSANTLLQTWHLKDCIWNLFMCLWSFFLWLKVFSHPGMSHWHSWQSLMWYFKSWFLLKTVLHVGHFVSSSTPVPQSSLFCWALSFQSCFNKGQCKGISTMIAKLSILVKIPLCCCNCIYNTNSFSRVVYKESLLLELCCTWDKFGNAMILFRILTKPVNKGFFPFPGKPSSFII